ncbi:GAF domain-containing SpoIIE family protein phosphatase [Sanguibacter antarcticus]|uniref:GAF domain-containing SpoIIE family protein phosphatase n=1 Tax=Sanguibacter antarcticus TaxID=372484 RepID=UPI001179E295|nr:SpoIIE family protein phosphatase [Sanguibacter antarcticus]
MPSTSPSSPRPGASASGAQLLDEETRERYARLARAQLGATAAVVSLTLDGAVHLGGSVASLVVARDAPVVSRDLQHDPALRDLLSGPDAEVGALVALPLRSIGTVPIGALCVVDAGPRDWSDSDLELCADLADVCSSELRLRGEHARSREIQRLTTQTNRQSRLLLLLSDAFADAITIDDVATTAGRVATTGLGARYAGLALLDEDGMSLTYTSLDGFYDEIDENWRTAYIGDDRPLSLVALTRKPMMFTDSAEMVRKFPMTASVSHNVTGARGMLPLISSGKLLGVLTLVWDMPRVFDEQSRAIKTALAGYTAQALDRAQMLAARQGVARTLQAAMLSPLPTIQGVTFASIYEPAARTEEVGGDWYDAIELPDGSIAVMIGDVTGHDVAAAAVMGQLRSMLRAFAWEHNEPPSAILSILDKTNRGIKLDATGTAIVARLSHEGDGLRMRWSSAGHPPPVVARADGTVEILQGRNGLMLGVEPSITRHDHEVLLGPGDVLVLYTDGLVERRDEMFLDGLRRLVTTLESSGTVAFAELPSVLVRDLVGDALADDIAVLLVRVDAQPAVPAPGAPTDLGEVAFR